jgi:uncharacterized protein HemY
MADPDMEPLELAELRCLVAASGWLGLGNCDEARLELAALPPERQNHPDVLEARWQICAQEGSWTEALEIAQTLVSMAPDLCTGWLHQAYALRRVSGGGLKQAWDALLPAHEKFPREPTIAYNLSCYACQMHDLDTARGWLRRALNSIRKRKIRNQFKLMASTDPDLEPLWKEIKGM